MPTPLRFLLHSCVASVHCVDLWLERKPMAAAKGGARRMSVPPVELDALQLIFDEAVRMNGANAFCLGSYDTLKVSQACNAAGLYQNSHYVKKLYEISEGEIMTSQLKQCLLKYAHSHNNSNWNDGLWAGKLASQFSCLLSHVRRLQRDPAKLRQCIAGATGVQRNAILELVELKGKACKKAQLPMDNGASASAPVEESKACKKASLPVGSPDSGSAPMAEASASGEQACKKARTLKKEISEVSLDSRGYPSILASPKEKKQEAAKSKGPGHVSILDKRRQDGQRQALEEAAEAAVHDFVEQPAKKPERRPNKKPAGKDNKGSQAPWKRPASKSIRKSTAQAASVQDGPERRPWCRVKKTLATDQSYLQGFDGKSWKLIVSCTAKMGAEYPGGHQAVINELEKVVMNENMTKQKMVEERNDVLKNVD